MSILKSTNTGEFHFYEKITVSFLRNHNFRWISTICGDSQEGKVKHLYRWHYEYKIVSFDGKSVVTVENDIYQDDTHFLIEYELEDNKIYHKEIRHTKDFYSVLDYFDTADVEKRYRKLKEIHKNLKEPNFRVQQNYSKILCLS